MFKELAPLARHRAVLFTLTHVEEDQFRVNVIPKKIGDGENDALTTPVSVTGTVEDLDRDLPETLLHFVASHLGLKNTLDRAKAEMEEASKAARAEAKKRSGNQTAKKEGGRNYSQPAEPLQTTAPANAEIPKAASLFDPVSDSGTPPEAEATKSNGVQAIPGEPQVDEDEEILREAYQEGDTEKGDETD